MKKVLSVLLTTLRIIGKIIFIIILLCILAYTILVMLVRPSNDRDWNTDQAVLPYAEISQAAKTASATASSTGTIISIHNIRNFSYTSTSEYEPAYYDKTFELDKLKRVWFIVEPFSGFAGAAHTFLSFEFEKSRGVNGGDDVGNPDDPDASSSDFVAISVEIRKQKGESFSAVKGLLRNYELMYVIADEKDVVRLRSNFRKDLVYAYPVKTSPQKAQTLFLNMIRRTNKLHDDPEFYNTLTNTCTTNIVSHINSITPKRVPFDISILFPANSDKYAYDLGLIDTDLSFEQAREKYLINARAMKYADDPDFSQKIRSVDSIH
jgi:hypothetical protein